MLLVRRMVSELRIPFIAILEFQKRSAQRQSQMRYILVQFETRFSSSRLFTDFRWQAERFRCLLTSTAGMVRLRNKRTLRGFDCVNSALPNFVGSTDMLSSIFTLSQAAYNCPRSYLGKRPSSADFCPTTLLSCLMQPLSA